MTEVQDDDTLAKWMSLLAAKTSGQLNDAIYEWALPVRKERIECLYRRLLKLIAWKSSKKGAAAKADQGRRSRIIGLVYERMLRGLFDSGVLSVETNLRTTTSEIDLLLKVEPTARVLPLFDGAGTHVIGEAKCHAKAPSSELVNELRGFIDTHSAKLAFLFVFCTSRSIATDARQAIALHGAQGRYIVPLGRKQIEQVIAGVPVCRILSEQRVHAANATTKLSV